jgi:hypothetical protein
MYQGTRHIKEQPRGEEAPSTLLYTTCGCSRDKQRCRQAEAAQLDPRCAAASSGMACDRGRKDNLRFQDEPITDNKSFSLGPTPIYTWVRNTSHGTCLSYRPPSWESSLQLGGGADEMQQAVRLAAGVCSYFSSSASTKARRHADERTWGETPSSADVWYCDNAALFPNRNSPAAASRHCCAASVPSRQRPSRDVIPHSDRATTSHTTQPNPSHPIPSHPIPSHPTRPHPVLEQPARFTPTQPQWSPRQSSDSTTPEPSPADQSLLG